MGHTVKLKARSVSVSINLWHMTYGKRPGLIISYDIILLYIMNLWYKIRLQVLIERDCRLLYLFPINQPMSIPLASPLLPPKKPGLIIQEPIATGGHIWLIIQHDANLTHVTWVPKPSHSWFSFWERWPEALTSTLHCKPLGAAVLSPKKCHMSSEIWSRCWDSATSQLPSNQSPLWDQMKREAEERAHCVVSTCAAARVAPNHPMSTLSWETQRSKSIPSVPVPKQPPDLWGLLHATKRYPFWGSKSK